MCMVSQNPCRRTLAREAFDGAAMKSSRALLLTIITVVGSCGSVTLARQALKTGDDLLQGCKVIADGATPDAANSLEVGVCLGEIEALNWGAPGVNDENIRSCNPAVVTNKQMAEVIVDYLEQNPERRGEPFEGLALEALAHRWPCPSSGRFGK